MNRCDKCRRANNCELAYIVNFCDDCKDADGCPMRTQACKAGYDIECNNGFEEATVYDE